MHCGHMSKQLCKHISSKKYAINPLASEWNARWEPPKHQNFNSMHNWASDYSWRLACWTSYCVTEYLTSGAKGLIVQSAECPKLDTWLTACDMYYCSMWTTYTNICREAFPYNWSCKAVFNNTYSHKRKSPPITLNGGPALQWLKLALLGLAFVLLHFGNRLTSSKLQQNWSTITLNYFTYRGFSL
jgi:hypothetical protein